MIVEIIKYIQWYTNTYFFDKKIIGANMRDEWKPEWLIKIGNPHPNVRVTLALRELHIALDEKFGEGFIRQEEPIILINDTQSGYRFDFFVPSENTAIEICFSAVKNEFEKDILKAMSDKRVKKLYILARDYYTGRIYYGLRTMQHPGPQSFISLVSRLGIEVIPEKLSN